MTIIKFSPKDSEKVVLAFVSALSPVPESASVVLVSVLIDAVLSDAVLFDAVLFDAASD